MRRFFRFPPMLFSATRITLFRHTPPLWINPVNPRHEQIEALLLQANALVKNYDFISAAALHDQIRALPEFSPENYLPHLHDLFRTYAFTDVEKLRELFTTDQHADYYRRYRSKTNNTALHIALENGLMDVAERIATKDNVCQMNDSGYAPIHIAFQTQNFAFLEFVFRKFGSDISKLPYDATIQSILVCDPYPDDQLYELAAKFFDTGDLYQTRPGNGHP